MFKYTYKTFELILTPSEHNSELYDGNSDQIYRQWYGQKPNYIIAEFVETVNYISNKYYSIFYKDYELEVFEHGNINHKTTYGGNCAAAGFCVGNSPDLATVLDLFRKKVDESIKKKIQLEKIQDFLLQKQLELEKYLQSEGYIFDIVNDNLYAIYPDYYDHWKDEPDYNFPLGVVILIGKNTEISW